MISGGASTYIGYDSNDGVGFLEPNTITVLPDEPNELITRFVAQGLTYGMLQFGFTSMELGSPFKSINLVFTFPELSLQPVANAMVSLYDESNAFIANLGFTDNSGVIMFADFTLSPGGYWFQAGATGYMINRVSYTVLSEAPINDEIEIAIQKLLIPPDE